MLRAFILCFISIFLFSCVPDDLQTLECEAEKFPLTHLEPLDISEGTLVEASADHEGIVTVLVSGVNSSLVSLSADSQILWETDLTDKINPSGFIKIENGGLIIIGELLEESLEGSPSRWGTIHTNESGVILNTSSLYEEDGLSLIEIVNTHDGDYMIAGIRWKDFKKFSTFYAKISIDGKISWEKTLSIYEKERPIEILKNEDKSFTIVNKSMDIGFGNEMTLVKVDERGEIRLIRSMFSSLSFTNKFVFSKLDGDQTAIGITAFQGAGITSVDAMIITLDEDFSEVSRLMAGSEASDQLGDLLSIDNDTYIVSCTNTGCSGLQNILYLTKLSSEGTKDWELLFAGNYTDEHFINMDENGNFHIIIKKFDDNRLHTLHIDKHGRPL